MQLIKLSHFQTMIQLEVSLEAPKGFDWNLNYSLNYDPKVSERFEQELERFFFINDTPDILVPTLWESHKTYIRGIL